jgi:AmmeMemoRadiSam system protein B
VILSPRHFPVGSSPIAFSPLDWETGLGRVAADRALADRLRRAVGAAWDPWSFHGEHGVGSLLPFIAKRFPRARVVPIVLEIEGRKADALAELGRALAAEAMRNKGIFVLVSADFSHHAGPELTAERDGRSRAALLGLDSRTARDIYSDDPAGIRALCEMLDILGRRGGEILRHATAQDLVGEREDVTSYFFCYF